MLPLIKSRLPIYQDIPPLAWWLMLGTGTANLLNFACLPFLAIILAKQGVNPVYIGIVLGVGPLVGLVVGLLGSSLSDYWGRRVVILFSLYLWAISFFLFSITSLIPVYILVSGLLGLCQSLFEPTCQALLSDLVPKEKIKIIFRLRYLIVNVGVAFGPLLGAIFALVSEKSSFLLAAGFFAIYALVMTQKMRHIKFTMSPIKKTNQFLKQTFSIILIDKILLRFLLGGICVAITYSQFSSTLPQYIFSNGLSNFSYAAILMVNAFGVLIFQLPVSKIADKFKLLSGMRIGALLLFLGYLVMAVSNASLVILFLGMLVITFGELFISPVQNVVVTNLATEDTYGLYFGAYNLRQLGFSLGPILGSYILATGGGMICFLSVAMFGMLACYFFGAVQARLTDDAALEECNTES